VARRLAITRAPARAAGAAPPEPGRRGLAPSEKLKLEAQLAEIDDPRLKAALMKLGRAALGAGSGEGGRTPPKRMG
jgi:hypothetical protein